MKLKYRTLQYFPPFLMMVVIVGLQTDMQLLVTSIQSNDSLYKEILNAGTYPILPG